MREEKRKAPKLRFPGFEGDWEQCKFEDYYKMSSGHAFKYQDYCENGVPLINGESIQHGKIDDSNLNNLPSSFVNDYPAFALHEKDIVVGLNRPITNGNLKIARIPSNYEGSLLYQRAGKIQYKKEIDVDFSYILLSQEILKFTLREAVGSDQPFISTSKLDKWIISIPSDKDEQARMGSFFMSLENLIALHQCKLDQIKEYKKGMLQKMFPKKGETVPEVRFPGFEGDWEHRKFRDVSDKLCVGFVGTCEKFYTDESKGIPLYRTGNIKDGVLVEYDMKYVTREFHEKNKKSQLKKNDIVIARFGENGLGALYLKEEEANCLNCIILHVDNRMSPEYVKQYLSSDIFRNKALANTVGSTFSILNTTTLGKMDIPYTDIIEQKQIGEFLTNLDNLISLHQQKLDEMKEYKKGLLQQMFV